MQNKHTFISQRDREAIRFTPLWEAWKPLTPMGKVYKLDTKPFRQDQHLEWQREMDDIALLLPLIKDLKRYSFLVKGMEDIRPILTRWKNGISPERLDWFQILQFLHQGYQVLSLPGWDCVWQLFPKGSELRWQHVLQELSTGDGVSSTETSFQFERLFPELFDHLINQYRKLEQDRLQMQRERKQSIEKELGFQLSGKSPFYIPRQEQKKVTALTAHPAFAMIKETPFDVAFAWVETEEDVHFDELKSELDHEWQIAEGKASEILTRRLSPYREQLIQWVTAFGRIDALYAKAVLGSTHKGIMPTWDPTGKTIQLEGGIHPYLAKEWGKEQHGRSFTPINISLQPGKLAVIVGPNMGGKSVAMKTLGLCTLLAQYGFLVPAESFRFTPIDGIVVIGGEQEHMEAGLSSFGGEVEQLVQLFNRGEDERLLVLCDEVGRGTNPEEGEALALAVAETLGSKPWFTCYVSHFSAVLELPHLDIYQITGLPPDFDSKQFSLETGDNWIDYRLQQVEKGTVPQAALTIADWLGLPQGILERARTYLKKNTSIKGGEAD